MIRWLTKNAFRRGKMVEKAKKNYDSNEYIRLIKKAAETVLKQIPSAKLRVP